MTDSEREYAIRRQELASDVDALSGLIATANRSRELGVAPPRRTSGIIRACRGWASELANPDPAPREALTGTTPPASGKEPDSR